MRVSAICRRRRRDTIGMGTAPRSNIDGRATLDAGRWEEAACQRIEGVVRRLGAGSPSYDRDRPPYAVFD
ncbi:MAG: hypothetical protein WBQ79_19745 [Acidobacteriaceae bacterium]